MAIKVTGIYTVCTGFSDYLEKNMNKYSWYVIALLASPIISADQHQMDHSLHENHGHTGHSHQQAVDGAELDVNPEKFDFKVTTQDAERWAKDIANKITNKD